MNLVTVICHDLGRYLGCYGIPGVRSPNIDRFAEQGLLLENAFCVAPQCSPSRAAMWTGRYPHANGVVGLCHGPHHNDLNPDEVHLAHILKRNGYTTWLFGGQHETRDTSRLEFDFVASESQRYSGPLAERFAAHLETHDKAEPFFAEICFFEPHRDFPRSDDVEVQPADAVHIPPYLPALDIVREDLVDFEASIASMDRSFGQILEAIDAAGLADDTLVVFTADHGIPFPLAKMTLYDAGLEIPFVVRGPGIPIGKRSGAVYSNVDFTPSILEFLGVPAPDAERFQGTAARKVLNGDDTVGRATVFAEKTFHTYYDPMRCIRTRDRKLIVNFETAPRQETASDYQNNGHGYPEVSLALGLHGNHPVFELFDLHEDPLQQHNLADDPAHAETLNDLKRRLHDWMRETGDPLLDGPVPSGSYRSRLAAFVD